MHDTIIRGGTVVDGTGSAGRTADIAIDGGRIVEIGRVVAPAIGSTQSFNRVPDARAA